MYFAVIMTTIASDNEEMYPNGNLIAVVAQDPCLELHQLRNPCPKSSATMGMCHHPVPVAFLAVFGARIPGFCLDQASD